MSAWVRLLRRTKSSTTIDVVEVIEDAFGSAGMGDFEREVVVARDGARFYGVYDFPQVERHIANVGDVVSLRLTLNNSFDRSCGLNWAIGLLRKVCSNGMCSLVADTNVTKKHSSKLDLSFIKEGIDASVEKFDASIEAFQSLSNREITQKEGGLILDNLAIKKVLSESLRDSIQMVWDSPSFGEDQGRNLYNLYNATTEHLTREVQPTRFRVRQPREPQRANALDTGAAGQEPLRQADAADS